MEKNIFEGAKFGDKFITMDGQTAIYHGYFHDFHCLNIDGMAKHIKCFENGKSCLTEWRVGTNWSDIVSRYQEPIDEEKIKEIAKNTHQYDIDGKYVLYKDSNSTYTSEDLDIVFQAAYRKAKER